MKDTSAAIKIRFQNMIMKRSPEERLLMGSSMFDTAKQIVRSSIIEQYPKILPKEMNEKIFLRFYGTEFNEVDKKKILNVLSK
ncbi:hypothetical protein KAW08_05920 [bacterium]|nr:hypothetical protein [bacterium]